MRLRSSALALMAAPIAAPALANAQAIVSEALQREAMTCVGEAAQICPDVWTAPDHGLTCMTGKRRSFSPRCRVIYDEVARGLRRGGR